jgi:hypothetical protein
MNAKARYFFQFFIVQQIDFDSDDDVFKKREKNGKPLGLLLQTLCLRSIVGQN